MAKKKSAERLDREIVKALGKRGKLWEAPEKKTRPKPAAAPKPAPAAPPAPATTATIAPRASAPEAAKKETVCRYCGQKLHWSDGHFECGGEGNGVCSFWAAIGDYDRAGRPKDVESWIDRWLQHEVGTTWAGIDWDRAKHIKAIRDYFKLK